MMINFILPILFYSFLGLPTKDPSQTGRVVMVNPTISQVTQMAEGENKVALLYFTGHACINSRKFETNILQNTEVSKYLAANMISAVFYVDDKKILPKNDQNIHYQTVGGRNVYYQFKFFKTRMQPYVVVINHKGVLKLELENKSNPTEFLNQLKKLKD